MFFSERFQIDAELIKAYGAVDISLVCDTPLFIDPMLIFNSDREDYKKLHQEIIKYFHFLNRISRQTLANEQINAWFRFKEVPNNWLGYSMDGNKGSALGSNYAQFLYHNIGFALETHGISQSQHIEKAMLLYEGSGKDKISDLTVNLIKRFLCEYTQKFAKEYIAPDLCIILPVENAYFNYDTESFVSKEYFLPFVLNEKGKPEYVLLTPFDILRMDEPAINRVDFLNSHERIRAAISNSTLRAFINNHISNAVKRYEEERKRSHRRINDSAIQRVERTAFQEIVNEYPELYDYYIMLREVDTNEIRQQSIQELNQQLEKLLNASKRLVLQFEENDYSVDRSLSAREEAKRRLLYFKHIIEDCDGYKNLYVDGKRIAYENDLQRLFRFVWYGTNYKVDAEANNGRGQADFIISSGNKNQNIVEFKLASNSSLSHVFTQVDIYEAANCTNGSLIAIFYFTEGELLTVQGVVKSAGYENMINTSIFLIDCRIDNKPSASIA